jgi:two-component SAPR family response regulator
MGFNLIPMDGFEFLEQLSSIEDLQHNDTSVILLSSASYEVAKNQVNKLGILGYMEKPVEAEKVLELVIDKYKPLQ